MANIQKNCGACKITFEITPEDRVFYEKVSPVWSGKKYLIPDPTLCPDCRQQRRLAFRNERHLYHRKCDLTGRALISNFSPSKPYKVYDQKEWWGDKWDPRDYGRDFDFNRPFFEQFDELMKEVPIPHIISSTDVAESNCIYTNYAGHNKNCYLVFDSDFDEDCMYGNVVKHSKSCMDCSYVTHSELLYGCTDCNNCYNLKYSQDCTSCSDSYFLKNCIACKNCIGCVNLRQKEYHIFNKPYSKADYEKELKGFVFGTRSFVKDFAMKFQEYAAQFPCKFFHGVQIEHSSGDYLYNTSGATDCFNVANARDLKYCDSLFEANDCMDTSSFGEHIQLVYESGTVGINATNVLFSHCVVNDCYNISYSHICRSAHDVFGCAGIKRGEYCVLNKQYSRHEYEVLVSRIIEHMKTTGEFGEYFPMSLSPFGYNETVAADIFPLSEEECVKQGLQWKNSEEQNTYQGPEVVVPDRIHDADEILSSQILKCASTKKFYKILPQEFAFYKKWNIPLPDESPDARHLRRLHKRNPRKLHERQCAKCGLQFQTSYGPERSEAVYCEKCYNEFIL